MRTKTDPGWGPYIPMRVIGREPGIERESTGPEGRTREGAVVYWWQFGLPASRGSEPIHSESKMQAPEKWPLPEAPFLRGLCRGDPGSIFQEPGSEGPIGPALAPPQDSGPEGSAAGTCRSEWCLASQHSARVSTASWSSS